LLEFKRYSELIKRPRIMQALTPERETLLGQLTNYAKVRIAYAHLKHFKHAICLS